MCKVSVIVPVYNAEQYLDRCVESLVGQTLSDIEIILVDDLSTDGSWQKMQEWESKYPAKVKIAQVKEKAFAGGARNVGIRMAQGEYIGLVDSDDWVDSRIYEDLYEQAKREDLDVVRCGYRLVDEAGNFRTPVLPDVQKWEEKIRLGIGPVWRRLVLYNGNMLHWCGLWRREIIVRNGLMYPEKMYNEDSAWLYLVYMYVERIGISQGVYYNYCMNGGSQTATARKIESRYFMQCSAAKWLLDEYVKRGWKDRDPELVEYVFSCFYFIDCIYGAVSFPDLG